jgi:hypothetical protein
VVLSHSCKGYSRAVPREHFEIRTFRFDLRPSEWGGDAGGLTFKGAGSNVVAALQQARERFVGQPLAAMLVLSDGLDTSGIGAGFTLPGGLPVHTFELEKPFELPAKAKRVWISAVDPPGRIVVGWDAEVRGAVSASGMSGRTLNVELWRDGVKAAETAVTFNEDEQTRPVVFPVAGTEPGVLHCELRLSDPAADPDAKTRHFAIEVVALGKRIMYVQNSFGFEFKFLRRAVAGERLFAAACAGAHVVRALGEALQEVDSFKALNPDSPSRFRPTSTGRARFPGWGAKRRPGRFGVR